MGGEPSSPSDQRPYRLLLVEDDTAVMRFLNAVLADRGYDLIQARNGVEAMVALTVPDSDLPHAVILDLGLPLESGVSVLTFVRNVMRSGVPVIVLTGRDDPEEERAVRQLGVSAYLRKPAATEQLVAAVTSALR